MERIRQLASHLSSSPTGRARLLTKSPDDVVITLAVRSPLTKAGKGGFKDTRYAASHAAQKMFVDVASGTGIRSDELLTSMFKAAIANSNIDPALIQDISVGTVGASGAMFEARAASLAAGIPETTPIQVVNRFCSSGLMAVTAVANQIRAGQIEIGLAVGVESMSAHPDKGAPQFSDDILAHAVARDCVHPMGWTSENVAEDFNISRIDMDKFAAISYQRAERAQKQGWFDQEIVPVEGFVKDPNTDVRSRVMIAKDDGIRYGTTPESLSKIRPAFPQWGGGKTTGGNASQITDGAAAILLMTRRKAEELNLKIIAKYVTTAISGLAPRIMGIWPTYAIPKVLEHTGLSINDVDLFEINEAFASMYVYCVRKLGLDHEKVNVNGGAIALGHPLDKQVATGLAELHRRGQKVLVTSMCMGLGMGAAAVFVAE